eukprot:20997-Heterococcus_DN1.PRE.1
MQCIRRNYWPTGPQSAEFAAESVIMAATKLAQKSTHALYDVVNQHRSNAEPLKASSSAPLLL